MSNSVKTVTAAEKKRCAPKKRLLFIEEEPARVEKTKPSVVEEPTVVEETKPVVVEEPKPAVVEEPKPAVVEEPKKPQQSIWMQMRRISNMKIPLRWEGIEDISDDEDDKVDIQLLKMKKYQENIEYENYLLRLEGFQSAGFFLNW